MKKLSLSGVAPKSQLDEAQRDYDVADAKLGEARRNEQLVKAGALEEDVAKAEADIHAAEQRMHLVQEKLQKCVVTAPIDGTVLRVLMRPGESFSTLAPQALFSMADISIRRVRAEVDERDVGKVHIGQKVLITSDSFPDKQFAGGVQRIAQSMGHKRIISGDPSEKTDRDVLEAMIDLDPKNANLPVGIRVVVQFTE
jgi:HlyD family secretion protein